MCRKNIVFEFDIQGKYYFLKKELIFDSKIDGEFYTKNDPMFHNLFNNLVKDFAEDTEDNSFFEAINILVDVINKSSMHGFEVDTSDLMEEFDLAFRIIIEFSNDIEIEDTDCRVNLTQIVLQDSFNDTFLAKQFREDYKNGSFCFDEDGFIKYFIENTETIGLHVNFSIDENLNQLFGNIFNSFPLEEGSSIPILPSLKNILDFHSDFIYTKDKGVKYFNSAKKWKNYTDEMKRNLYYEVIKFTFVYYKLIPNILFRFFIYKHLPTIREIPKPRYILEDGELRLQEYYGLLNLLKNDELLFEINEYLLKLGFNCKVNISQTNNDALRIQLINENHKLVINFHSSSSGLIQVFPIIAFCVSLFERKKNKFTVSNSYILSNNNIFEFVNYKGYSYSQNSEIELFTNNFTLLLIEQPELHLHPKLQSKLAELFSETIKNSDNNMFIETHSEHLIRKIQVLIANGELDRDKVSVMYFDNNEGSTKIKKMEIEENGFFKEPWPYGFFDDSANLSWELLTANKN